MCLWVACNLNFRPVIRVLIFIGASAPADLTARPSMPCKCAIHGGVT